MMDDDAQIKATADAERLIMEWGPTPDEAMFIRDRGEAILAAVVEEFLKRTQNGSKMRPMAIAYPAFAAAAWALRVEQENEE